MKYLFTILLFLSVAALPAQRGALEKGIALYEAKDYNAAFKKLTPVMKRLHRLSPPEQAAAVYYYNLVKINIFKRMYRMGMSDKLYNFLLEGYRGFNEVEKYDRNDRWEDDVRLYKTMYYPFVMESAENLLAEAQSGKGLSESKRMQNYLDAESFVRLGQEVKPSSAAYVLLGQIELGKDDPKQAYSYFSRALTFYQKDPQRQVDFSIGKALYYKALIEHASNLTGTAIKTLRWGQVFLENEHLRYNTNRDNKAPIIQVKIETQYMSVQEDLRTLEAGYMAKSPGELAAVAQMFERELEQNPGDYLQLIAYGSLLEEKDAEKAVQLYQQATQASEHGLLALKKLGLFLYKETRARNGSEHGRPVAFSAQIPKEEAEMLEKIYAYLQKVIAGDPESGEVLEALLYIADRLDLREDYRAYRAMRDKIDR